MPSFGAPVPKDVLPLPDVWGALPVSWAGHAKSYRGLAKCLPTMPGISHRIGDLRS